MINLKIKRLIYEISSNNPLTLKGDFPTVTLRGAFGYSLVQIIARDEAIGECDKVEICKRLFFSNDISEKSKHKNSARPFVMRGKYTRPDKKAFVLEIILFGEAATAEFLIDNIVENMCFMGLGYSNEVCNYKKLKSEDIIPEKPVLDSGICIVNYKTPTRIKHNKNYFKDNIPFYYLFARFADRLSEIVNIYSDTGSETDMKKLKNYAEKIGTIINDGSYYNTKRHSTRTSQWCSLSGFIGSITYTGNLKPFENILSYLPWINVGSSAAFGCGWCTLKYK